MNNPITIIKQHGYWGLFHKVGNKLFVTIRALFRKLFFNKYIFYKYDKTFLEKEMQSSIEIDHYRFESINDIPKDFARQLSDPDMERGNDYWKIVEKEFNKGCIFWLSTNKDGELACSQWSRRGKTIKKWHIPLKDEDIVIFGGVVRVKWRGKRILPLQLQYIINIENNKGGDAYCDIVEWNKPSIKACTKAGFVQMGVGRKIIEEN